MACAAFAYLAHSWLRWRNHLSGGFDLGIFDQAIRRYAMFAEPEVPILGLDFHLLGDHFHPVLLLFVPVYWVWPHPMALNVALVALLVSTAVPVYLFCREQQVDHPRSLMYATVLLAWWPFQALVNWDFHEVAFAVPLLAWVVLFLEREWLGWVVALCLPLLLVREDLGVTMAAVGLLLCARRWWGPGLLLVVVGLAGFLSLTKWVIPAFAVSGTFRHWQYSQLGEGPGEALLFAVTHPMAVLAMLFDHPYKQTLWAVSFVPLLGLPLFSPYGWLAMPILVSRLLNDRENVWVPVYQYDAVLVPLLLMGTVHTLTRLGRARGWERPHDLFAVWLLALSAVGTFIAPALFPLGLTATGESWALPAKVPALNRALAQIPDGVCAEVPDKSAPHLTDRAMVGLHNSIGDELTTWMVIDTTVPELGGVTPLTPDQAMARAERLGFEVVTADDEGIWTLKRDLPNPPRCRDYVGL
ncbi:MAG: DUF2079 domain-containing protein [Deltaproteobacteria bacterium]|nr:MAG: DUF2079 domain-containing protein [Deltaproteobacteria bacterium]